MLPATIRNLRARVRSSSNDVPHRVGASGVDPRFARSPAASSSIPGPSTSYRRHRARGAVRRDSETCRRGSTSGPTASRETVSAFTSRTLKFTTISAGPAPRTGTPDLFVRLRLRRVPDPACETNVGTDVCALWLRGQAVHRGRQNWECISYPASARTRHGRGEDRGRLVATTASAAGQSLDVP